ncbi:MAG: DUF3429 domain-containing protein [Alteromonadaceae bacterium]|nr:DUF3429 domain-containing protein [Alteromonadaceae bacterium]
MNQQFKQLGYAGLLPFIGLNALAFTQILPQALVFLYFTQYSAVLLSFFGGIHWYDAISGNKDGHQKYMAMLPTLIGWVCLMHAGAPWVLATLSVSYLAIMFYDKQVLTLPKELVVEYTRLRMHLTTVVVICHAVMILIR